ncbi:hypothetical protein [Agrobacterium sp. Azo12]|jgi:hypothetical protein|uniref:hypothetical protein n=1 Tax=Agrobacterium sp. Azo12 TaxID=3031129 RepID=UPI0023D8850F|nr:hypothetical protein [Agrobacterium sp. Azo12]MDO5898455.1 hypothetical protein [Agrobacterium sp. Azo12]
MKQSKADTLSECKIEILPPDRRCAPGPETVTCPCCQKARPASTMDADGCGICDECLAP